MDKDYQDELEAALVDVLDGVSWYDLQYNTGLSEERCKEISNLYNIKVFPNYKKRHNL